MDRSSSPWTKGVRCVALTDVGLRRANNQDAFATKEAVSARQWLGRGHLFVVADGMGAHAAGEVASNLAAETVTQSYLKRTNQPPAQALVQAVYEAHRVIREKSRREDAYRDMGTTCDAFAMLPQGLLVAHVGDSRVYRVRDQVIEQLTFDHSLVWEVCVATNIPFDQAPTYIPKNQITRSLGPSENLVVDLEGPFPIEIGDTFLACSDGLSGQVSDREIGEILRVFPPNIAGEFLINLANLRGGPDNITLVIAQAIQCDTSTQEVDEELSMPPSDWITLATALIVGLGSLGAFFIGMPLIGCLTAVCALIALVLFVMRLRSSSFDATSSPHGQQAGKGPYTKTTCPPSMEFAEDLKYVLNELRQATRGHQLSVKSVEADECEAQAIRAVHASDPVGAIRNFAVAINHLMRELKKMSVKKK